MQRPKFFDYFWLNKLLMQSCGILPVSKNNYINNFIILVSYTAASYILLPAYYSLLFHWNEVDTMEKANILNEQLQVTVTMIKVTTLLIKRQKIVKLIEKCDEMWEFIEDDKIYQRISTYLNKAKYLTYGFTANVFGALIAMFTVPLVVNYTSEINGTFNDNKQLPFTMGIFRANSQNFHFLYALQIPTSFFSILVIIATDTSIAFFTLYGCALARLCQIYFTNALIFRQNDRAEKLEIKKSIIVHQKFFEYFENVEDVFNKMMLVEMMNGISGMCGFSISFLMQKDARFKTVLQVLASLLQLWLYCWPSHSLKLESAAVAHSVFYLPWYNWSVKTRKIISIVIVRSQILVTLTAGKFFPVSVETFTAIISKAASVFTVFRHII